MSNEFENYKDKIGLDFSAEIVDYKFTITPAEAGIALLSYVQIVDDIIDAKDKETGKLLGQVDWLSGDNNNLRDLLERVYSVLTECGHQELADECIELAYPIAYISEDGEVGRL